MLARRGCDDGGQCLRTATGGDRGSQLQRHAAAGARVATSRAAALGTIAAAAPTESRSREICRREIARDGPDQRPWPDLARLCGHHLT